MLRSLVLCVLSLFCLCFWLSECLPATSTEVDSGLQNTDARISIDLTSSLVKLTGQITFTNAGQKDITYYLLAVPPYFYQRVAWVGASVRLYHKLTCLFIN